MTSSLDLKWFGKGRKKKFSLTSVESLQEK